MGDMYAESLRHFLKPVAEHLDDPKVSEIMINGPTEIWIEKGGKLTRTDAKFTTEGIEAAARNMAQYVGRRLTEENPRLDARLPDGSRIHVVMPPIARKGCTISIRKFFPDKLTMDNLVAFGSMSEEMSQFINALVQTAQNVIVAGGTGSGKTTMLNCVASYVDDEERILTIEDSAELQLNQEHLVPFESRPPDKFGKGEVNMGHLLHSALRLRPDRIIVGEVRGGEAFHLMQAMNTGHGGSMATTHANTPTDTLRRLESLCLMSGIDLPMVAVRAQVASAINYVVCCARLHDGSRRTTHIAEVLPLNEKGDYQTQDIFVFNQTHKDEDGKIHGYHTPTGIVPNIIGKLASFGFENMDESYFDPFTYGLQPPPLYGKDPRDYKWVPSLAHREKGIPDEEVELPELKPRPTPTPSGQEKKAAPAASSAAPAKKPAPPPEPESAPEDEIDAVLAEEAAAAPEVDEFADPPTAQGKIPEALLGLSVPPDHDEEESTDPGAGEAVDDMGEDEDEAILAALAAEEDAPASARPADPERTGEASIKLSDDFAEEVAHSPVEETKPKPQPRKRGVSPGRPRRKKGGKIGS